MLRYELGRKKKEYRRKEGETKKGKMEVEPWNSIKGKKEMFGSHQQSPPAPKRDPHHHSYRHHMESHLFCTVVYQALYLMSRMHPFTLFLQQALCDRHSHLKS